MVDLNGKISVVTGAARGIGAAVATGLAECGSLVAAFDIGDSEWEVTESAVAAERIRTYSVDVTDYESVAKGVAAVNDDLGPVDILVNNAGIIRRGGLMDLTPEDWETVMAVNVRGVFNCCQAIVPSMRTRQSGRIINIGSVVGKTGDVTAAPVYGTSKGAVHTFTRSLARELAPDNVLVNCVAPHAIETKMSGQWSDEKRKSIVSQIPLGRLGRPEEVVAAVLYLSSPGAGFVTGETINVNGGFCMD